MVTVDNDNKISLTELGKMSKQMFDGLVKAVVDIEKEIMAVDAEFHADEEAELISGGSKQGSLWGINLYPDNNDNEWIEFDSMINLRPSVGNRSRSIEDPALRKKIIKIVHKLVTR